MIDFAQNVGFWLFLAMLMSMVGHLVYTVLKLVWDQGAIGEEVYPGEALIATAKTVYIWLQMLKSSWLATVCTVVVFILLWGSTEISFYASLGFSAMTYVISGVLTPKLLRQLKPMASHSQAAAPVVASQALQASSPVIASQASQTSVSDSSDLSV